MTELSNTSVLCGLYGLFLHSGHFSVQKGEAFLSYFGLKILLSRSLNMILVLWNS